MSRGCSLPLNTCLYLALPLKAGGPIIPGFSLAPGLRTRGVVIRRAFHLFVVAGSLLATSGCGSPPEQSSKSPEATTRLPVKGRITLLAVGDVNLGRKCGQYILKEGSDFPFRHLREWIESYDLAICNLESNISEQAGETEKPGNNLIFTAPPDAARALSDAGWDLVSTANNHSSDYGSDALVQTIKYLEQVGLEFNGTASSADGLYRPTIVRVKEYRLAFLAVTDVTNGPVRGTKIEEQLNLADRSRVLPALKLAKAQSDITILSYHGGVEYAAAPTPATREFLHWAIDNGVDLVLGHHPHVLQGTEHYKDGLIIYSLGNFTFVQNGNPWTRLSAAATITINQGRLAGVGFVPIRAHFKPQVITDSRVKRSVLQRISHLSLKLSE